MIKNNEIAAIGIKTLLYLILSGFAAGASRLCYFKALQLCDVNKVTAVDKASTVLTIIFAFIIIGGSISFLKIVIIVLIGTGMYIMIQKSGLSKISRAQMALLILAFSTWFPVHLCNLSIY